MHLYTKKEKGDPIESVACADLRYGLYKEYIALASYLCVRVYNVMCNLLYMRVMSSPWCLVQHWTKTEARRENKTHNLDTFILTFIHSLYFYPLKEQWETLQGFRLARRVSISTCRLQTQYYGTPQFYNGYLNLALRKTITTLQKPWNDLNAVVLKLTCWFV